MKDLWVSIIFNQSKLGSLDHEESENKGRDIKGSIFRL